MWDEAMRNPQRRQSCRYNYYYMCTNCFVASVSLNESEAGSGSELRMCLECGEKEHLVMRMSKNPLDRVKFGPLSKVNAEEGGVAPVRASLSAAARKATFASRDVSIEHRNDDTYVCENLEKDKFVATFTTLQKDLIEDRTPYTNFKKVPLARSFYVSNRRYPLLKAHSSFLLKMGIGTPPAEGTNYGVRSIDSKHFLSVNGKISSSSSNGIVFRISEKDNPTEYAIKCAITYGYTPELDKSPDKPRYVLAMRNVSSSFDIINEYLVEEALSKTIGKNNGIVSNSCLFGLLLQDPYVQENGASHDYAIMICIVMPKLACSVYSVVRSISTRKLRLSFAYGILGRTLETLAVMHSHGIIHADIKNDNLLLQERPEFSTSLVHSGKTAVICDFGLTQKTGGVGMTMTEDYRAPEVWLELDWGTGVDIWGIASSILEILTGGMLYGDISPKCDTDVKYLFRLAELFGPMPPDMITPKFQKYGIEKQQRNPSLDINTMASHYEERDRGYYQNMCTLLTQMLNLDPRRRATAPRILEQLSQMPKP